MKISPLCNTLFLLFLLLSSSQFLVKSKRVCGVCVYHMVKSMHDMVEREGEGGRESVIGRERRGRVARTRAREGE
jgi:hypothetical protein